MDQHSRDQTVIDFVRKVLEPAMTKLQQQYQPGAVAERPLANAGANFTKTYQINADGLGVDIVVSTKSAGLNFIVNRTGSSYIPRGCNFFYDYSALSTTTLDSCKGSIEDCILTVLETTR